MSIKIKNLKTEYKKNPIAVDCAAPRFFWQIFSDEKGVFQSSYRIRVASSEELLEEDPDMWDSGKVMSDETVGIVYSGKPLEGKKDYFWSVESDCGEAGNAVNDSGYFRTGLMSRSDLTAKWIENAEITAEDSPAHAGFLSRQADAPDTPLKVTVDLGTSTEFDCVVYYGLRIFETPGLADYPGYQFPRRYKIYIHDSEDAEDAEIIDDKTKELFPNPGAQPVFIFTGRKKARYVTFEAAELQADASGKYSFGLSQIEIFDGCDKISEGKKVTADEGWFEGEGFGPDMLTDGCPVWHKKGNAKSLPGPYFRKTFELSKVPDKAYVYVSALGLYELYINGEKVSDTYLAPEWTDYDIHVQYSCYEVSDMLNKGSNEILAMTGDGWYAGRIGMANVFGPKVLRGKYGKTPKFICQLDTGSGESIVTDGTWESCANTPVRANDIYDGEYYDARYEDIMSWENAREVDEAETADTALVSFMNEPVTAFEKISPVSVTEPREGVCVVDFGKNVSGFCEITMHGERNGKVILRHAGGLKKDGTGYFANLRGAFAIDTYIFKDSKKVTFRPHFTYHGFRYLEITGLDYVPSEKDVICHAISSGCEEIGKIEFENDFLNWLLAACKQTIRSNLVGVVTDCNDRDERLPWLMEGLESQSYLFDGALFWERHIREIHESWKRTGKMITQAPDGLLIEVKDGSVARTLINQIELEYALFGNTRITEDFYDFLTDLDKKNNMLYPDHTGGSPDYTDGDWLNTNKIMFDTGIDKSIPQISDQVFTCVTNARFYRAMYLAAGFLGKKDDMAHYKAEFDEARVNCDKILTDESGLLRNASQAAYGMMIFFDIVLPEKKQMFVEELGKIIAKSGTKFVTGVYTPGALIRAMSENGMFEEAYRMLTNDSCPSLKYMMDDGSNTVWERWDTRVKEVPAIYEKPRWQQQHPNHTIITENGYEDISMNSFNHIEYTTVTPWITEHAFGLKTDTESGAGMKHFTFDTKGYKVCPHAEGSFKTVRGEIKIEWNYEDGEFEAVIRVPANCTCTFYVPEECKNISVNGEISEGRRAELGSGKYTVKGF